MTRSELVLRLWRARSEHTMAELSEADALVLVSPGDYRSVWDTTAPHLHYPAPADDLERLVVLGLRVIPDATVRPGQVRLMVPAEVRV